MYEEFLAFAREQSGSVDLKDGRDCALARFFQKKYPKKKVMAGFCHVAVSGIPMFTIPEALWRPLVDLVEDQFSLDRTAVVQWKDIVEVLEHAHA